MRRFEKVGGSFRDPNGFTFISADTVYRQVNKSYRQNYEALLSTGLYDDLVQRQLLVPHTEEDDFIADDSDAFKVICPLQIPFISYPYEWCFSQLKDAALITLEILDRSLEHGMILKDASAYNIQFLNGKPVLIDTLSFETYQEGQAWVAYKQFCQHFLVPLALMSHKDIRLSQLLRVHIDGIPLDLATNLLPKRASLNSGILLHVQLHARAQRRFAGKKVSLDNRNTKTLGKRSLMNIVDSLRQTVRRLTWKHGETSWTNYYQGDSYNEEGFEDKKEIVSKYLSLVNPAVVWDLGANEGVYSRMAAARGAFTVSMDNDPGVVEANYLQAKREKATRIHPLLADLANPSAGIGWANAERASLADRSNADCILALALIHHIAISNNVPLDMTAEYFSGLAEWLIIEFVPKNDKKAQQLLASRKDIFHEYSREGFEEIYRQRYLVVRSQDIQSSDRVIYLLRRKPAAMPV